MTAYNGKMQDGKCTCEGCRCFQVIRSISAFGVCENQNSDHYLHVIAGEHLMCTWGAVKMGKDGA